MDPSDSDQLLRRAAVISRHLRHGCPSSSPLELSASLHYFPPESTAAFNPRDLRRLMDGHDLESRDWIFRLMEESQLFRPRRHAAGKVFVSPDYNQTMEKQREATMRRIEYLRGRGVYEGWLTTEGEEAELRTLAMHESLGIYDHSLWIKLAVHFFLWGGAIQFFGTKRHHDKWLKDTENYLVKGCFAMTELGHGSNVRGIETIATYDSDCGEFIVNTPCESAQKYWIGGAANDATHTIIFSQLYINGTNQGVHAFIAQIRDSDGNICPNIRIADCGHKIGLNGVDNGRIWFDNLRVPRENLLNSVADVLPDGQYVSAIEDRDQRFAAFLAPLTSGRVNIAVSAIYISKIGLAIALLGEYIAVHKMKKPFKGLGLEHMNSPCPIIPAKLTSLTLRSITFQIDAFCLRERDLLDRFANEVSHHQAQGESKEKAVILSYQLAEELARAFTERTILQTFVEAEMSVPDGPLKDVMVLLRSMYVLICIEEDAAFLRYGHLSTSNAAVARGELTRLCSQLRPHALSLVSSFGIPDSFLSPIAFDWIDANSWSRVHTE